MSAMQQATKSCTSLKNCFVKNKYCKNIDNTDFTLRMDYGANLTSTDDWDNDLQLNARLTENILYILYRLPLVQTLEMYEQVISIALWARHFQGLHLPFGYLNILQIRTARAIWIWIIMRLFKSSHRNISWYAYLPTARRVNYCHYITTSTSSCHG